MGMPAAPVDLQQVFVCDGVSTCGAHTVLSLKKSQKFSEKYLIWHNIRFPTYYVLILQQSQHFSEMKYP